MRPLRSILLLVFWAAILTGAQVKVLCQDSLADLTSFRQGCVALEDGRFETATALFEEAWITLNEGDTGDAERDFVASRLLRSHVANNSYAAALTWLHENQLVASSSETNLRVAQIYQAENQFAEAAKYYKKLQTEAATLNPALILNFATCLARSNEPQAALKAIASLPAPETPEEAIQRARISAEAGEFETALQLLDSATIDNSLSPELRLQVITSRIYALKNSERVPEAVALVDELLQSASNDDEGLIAFLILEQIKEKRSIPSLNQQMQKWSADKDHPAAATIALFKLLWFSSPDTLASELSKFANSTKSKSVIAEANLRLSSIDPNYSADHKDYLSLINDGELVARYNFLRTASLFNKGQFKAAADQFLTSANRLNDESRSAALYNGAVSMLQSGNAEEFSKIQQRLLEVNPSSFFNTELKFLHGLRLADEGDPAAFQILSQFTSDHPNHPHHVEALLALAEIQLNQAPARTKAARDIFEQLQSRSLSLVQQERLDYLSIWASLMADDSGPLLDLADTFMTNWPNSVYFPEVCMLAASHYYELKERKLAKEHFLIIGERFPDSDYAQTARFFAAKSTPRSESTIPEWKAIVQSEGKLAPYASHELGLLYLSLNRFEEARAEFEEVISKGDTPESLLYAVQADLGFAWFSEALSNNKNAEQLKEAAEIFRILSSSKKAPTFWRYNAAVRRGKCLEALGSNDVALEIYRSIIDETGDIDSLLLPELTLRELDWIFRAGFSAITLLKEREDWASAIRVADSLADRDGTRSFEATRLARSLRLKHWVWE